MKRNKRLFLKYGSYYKGQIGLLAGRVLANGCFATFPIKLIEQLINSSIQDATLQSVAMWGAIYLASQGIMGCDRRLGVFFHCQARDKHRPPDTVRYVLQN